MMYDVLKNRILREGGRTSKYFYEAMNFNIKTLYEMKATENRQFKRAYSVVINQFIKGIHFFFNDELNDKNKQYLKDLSKVDKKLFNKLLKANLRNIMIDTDMIDGIFDVCMVEIVLDRKDLLEITLSLVFGILTAGNVIFVIPFIFISRKVIGRLSHRNLRKKLLKVINSIED